MASKDDDFDEDMDDDHHQADHSSGDKRKRIFSKECEY